MPILGWCASRSKRAVGRTISSPGRSARRAAAAEQRAVGHDDVDRHPLGDLGEDAAGQTGAHAQHAQGGSAQAQRLGHGGGHGRSSDSLLGVAGAGHDGQAAQPQSDAVYPDEGRHPLGDEAVTADEAEQCAGRGRLRGAAGDGGHDALAVAVEGHRHATAPGSRTRRTAYSPRVSLKGET